MIMTYQNFSKTYSVRKLNTTDIDSIFTLCRGNPMYYEYCPPEVTRESIAEDMAALPPGVTNENKYYVGYWDGEKLVAVMDLIDGYPNAETVFIGFFMMDVGIQGKGIGTKIIEELVEYLRKCGYKSIQLAWVKGNPQAEHFWKKNGMQVIKETNSTAAESVLLAERRI